MTSRGAFRCRIGTYPVPYLKKLSEKATVQCQSNFRFSPDVGMCGLLVHGLQGWYASVCFRQFGQLHVGWHATEYILSLRCIHANLVDKVNNNHARRVFPVLSSDPKPHTLAIRLGKRHEPIPNAGNIGDVRLE